RLAGPSVGEYEAGLAASDADLLQPIFAVGAVIVFERSGTVFLIGLHYLHRCLRCLLTLFESGLIAVHFELVIPRLQLGAIDHGWLIERDMIRSGTCHRKRKSAESQCELFYHFLEPPKSGLSISHLEIRVYRAFVPKNTC